MGPKEMLASVLKRANLNASQREALEDIWDKLHRYGRLTPRQNAWVEKVYFDQKLDKEGPKMPRSASITHPSIKREVSVTSVAMLKRECSGVDGRRLKQAELFFQGGGSVLKVKPVCESYRS